MCLKVICILNRIVVILESLFVPADFLRTCSAGSSTQLILTFAQCHLQTKYGTGANKADLGTRSFFPDSLSAHFNSMDRYRSIAHFADYQVRSSLNRSKKDQWVALIKER